MTDPEASPPRPPASRRELLAGAGAALGAGAMVLSGCGGGAAAQTTPALPGPGSQRDVAILKQALELERRTVAAYIAGIPLLPRDHAKAAQQFLREELAHTGELISLIRTAGGKATPRANFYELGHPRNAAGVLSLLHDLEATQLESYLRWIPSLSSPAIRSPAASILTVDAQHVAMLRLLRGQTPVPAAFAGGAE